MPPELGEDFRPKWIHWCTWRRRQKKKRVSQYAARSQLAMLAQMGPELAREAIDMSIRNDWQGLFWPGERDRRTGQDRTQQLQQQKPGGNGQAKKGDVSGYVYGWK